MREQTFKKIEHKKKIKVIGAKLIFYSGTISSIFVISGVGKKGYFPIDTPLYPTSFTKTGKSLFTTFVILPHYNIYLVHN